MSKYFAANSQSQYTHIHTIKLPSKSILNPKSILLKNNFMLVSIKKTVGGYIDTDRYNHRYTESEQEEEEEEDNMERMKPPLHNFDLPVLKWGNQKHLRCMKVEDMYGDVSVGNRKRTTENYGGGGGGDGGYVTGTRRRESEVNKRFRSSDYNFPSSKKLNPVAGVNRDGEIEATREKLMFDFQTEVGKMKDAILRERLAVPPAAPAEKPWNLRTRRAACKAPLSPSSGVKVNGNGEVLKPNCSSSPVSNEFKYPNFRQANGVGAVESTSDEKRERPKFSVSVSRSELEDDFMALTGRRLPRKPKKRPRAVQRQLDTLFPGLWLSEITPDRYKVPEEADTGKR